MSEEDRTKAFNTEVRAVIREMADTSAAAVEDVERLIRMARGVLATELAGMPSEFQSWHLSQIRRSLDAALATIGEELGRAAVTGATRAHELGGALLDRPLAAGGLRIAAVLPEIDLRQLTAIRTFLLDRMKDVSREAAQRAANQIGLSMIGTQTPAEAATAVQNSLNVSRTRALTITRTEMGRAFSVAGQERFNQAKPYLPGLKKQWRRSGKIHSRTAHDLADGQIQDTDKPFTVNGVELMFPRDPQGPAKETINCGCVSLPVMESWEVSQPGRLPISDEEIRLDPRKRDLAAALQ